MFGMSPGKNCYLLATPVHARTLFSSAESAEGYASKNLGNWQAGFIVTLSASSFVVINTHEVLLP